MQILFSGVLVSLQFANDMHTSGRAAKSPKRQGVGRKILKDFPGQKSINSNQAE